MKKLEESLVAVLGAAGSAVATVTGAAINTAGYAAALVVLAAGAFTATGTLACKVQDSADGSTDWQDVSGAAFTGLIDSTDVTCKVGRLKLDGNNVRQYIRIVTVVGTAAAPHGVSVILQGNQYNAQSVNPAAFTV